MCLHLYSCLRTANFGTSPDCYICAEKDHSVYSAENGLETQRTGKNRALNDLLKYSWKELTWSSPRR